MKQEKNIPVLIETEFKKLEESVRLFIDILKSVKSELQDADVLKAIRKSGSLALKNNYDLEDFCKNVTTPAVDLALGLTSYSDVDLYYLFTEVLCDLISIQQACAADEQ